MNRDEVDRALRHLRDKRERIASALLDLEGHQGYRLLDGAALAGETGRRQAELRARTATLWTLFDLYGRTLGVITGLLDRREELRGRLEAYRVKAARLGHAEDPELLRLYDQARELLWSSPCDLRKATVTLSGYQQAISSRAKGPDR